VKQLRTQLEHLLGSRESWPTAVLRRLFDALMERAKGRRRSAEHERAWLNLSGYCLRPGFGHALDEWRIEQLWAMFDAGVQHHKDSQVCAEWWTMWRRVAGGLSVDGAAARAGRFRLQRAGRRRRTRPPSRHAGQRQRGRHAAPGRLAGTHPRQLQGRNRRVDAGPATRPARPPSKPPPTRPAAAPPTWPRPKRKAASCGA
jgi:hypothetical protein